MAYEGNDSNMNLANIFRAVDKDGNGEIDGPELQSALSNGTWMPFNPTTVNLMIKMFDQRGNGRIRMEEFGHLWKYVVDWQQCFKAFDKDNSGFIDAQELHMAFQAFGYRFSPFITNLFIKRFDRQNQGVLAFDDFIQSCVVLYNATDAFRHTDEDRDGVITIGYEQFLGIVLNLMP